MEKKTIGKVQGETFYWWKAVAEWIDQSPSRLKALKKLIVVGRYFEKIVSIDRADSAMIHLPRLFFLSSAARRRGNYRNYNIYI